MAGFLGGEVAHETAANRARRDVGDLAGKGQVALGEGAEEVAHEARVVRAGRGAGAQDALEVDEGHRGVDSRDDVDVDRHAGCGEGLGEHVARTRAAQNRAVAQGVGALGDDAAVHDEPDAAHVVAAAHDVLALAVHSLLGAEAPEHLFAVLRGDTSEERAALVLLAAVGQGVGDGHATALRHESLLSVVGPRGGPPVLPRTIASRSNKLQ